jgi:hypothetical protein
MPEELGWTSTRHELLAVCASGSGTVERHSYIGIEPVWVERAMRTAYKGNAVRALNTLFEHRLIALFKLDDGRDHNSAIVVTKEGHDVLGQWDADHPEQLMELTGTWHIAGSVTDGEAHTAFGVALENTYGIRLVVSDKEVGADVTRVAAALLAKLNGPGQPVLM